MALKGGRESNAYWRAPAGTPADYIPKTLADGTHIWVPVPSGGGGGTVLYNRWDELAPDAPTEQFEFDSTSLASFTAVNNRGTVDANTSATGKLFMNLPTQQYRYVSYLRALPGDTNYTIHSRVWVAGHPATTLVIAGGIVLSNTNTTNTGKQTGVIHGTIENFATARCVSNWDGFGETASGAAFPERDIIGGHWCDLRLRKNSGTYYAGWSGDGETWEETTFTIYGGVTPAYYGVYGQNYSGRDGQISFEYLRYYNNGTQTRTGTARNELG